MNLLDSKKEPEMANTELKYRNTKQTEICYLVCRDQLVTDNTQQFKVYVCITLCHKLVYYQFCYCWQTAGLHSNFVASFIFAPDKQFNMSYSSMLLVLDFQTGSSVFISRYLRFLPPILISYIKESQVFF